MLIFTGPPQGQQGGYYPQVLFLRALESVLISLICYTFQQPQQSYQQQPGYGGQYQGPPQGYPQQGYQPNPAPQTVYVCVDFYDFFVERCSLTLLPAVNRRLRNQARVPLGAWPAWLVCVSAAALKVRLFICIQGI